MSQEAYVECTECGHPLEVHTLRGCTATAETCSCPTRWTKREVESARRDAGLPAGFRAWDF